MKEKNSVLSARVSSEGEDYISPFAYQVFIDLRMPRFNVEPSPLRVFGNSIVALVSCQFRQNKFYEFRQQIIMT